MARVATSKHYNIDNSTNNRRDRKERYYLSLDFSYYQRFSNKDYCYASFDQAAIIKQVV